MLRLASGNLDAISELCDTSNELFQIADKQLVMSIMTIQAKGKCMNEIGVKYIDVDLFGHLSNIINSLRAKAALLSSVKVEKQTAEKSKINNRKTMVQCHPKSLNTMKNTNNLAKCKTAKYGHNRSRINLNDLNG